MDLSKIPLEQMIEAHDLVIWPVHHFLPDGQLSFKISETEYMVWSRRFGDQLKTQDKSVRQAVEAFVLQVTS